MRSTILTILWNKISSANEENLQDVCNEVDTAYKFERIPESEYIEMCRNLQTLYEFMFEGKLV